MGVGLVRSLQPPEILWIHWRVYNFIANTSKGVLFLPPSDAYVRSFLYLLYTLIKLYYTKALSNQASSLVSDWILLLRGPRILVSSRDSTTTFQYYDKIMPCLLLLLLLSHFSRVRLCVTPETAAHQAPPSLGFSRQEHWSGLPFPSSMHESEKWKWSRSVVSDS